MSTNIRISEYLNTMALEYYSYLCLCYFSSTNIVGYSLVDFWTTEYIQIIVQKLLLIKTNKKKIVLLWNESFFLVAVPNMIFSRPGRSQGLLHKH